MDEREMLVVMVILMLRINSLGVSGLEAVL